MTEQGYRVPLEDKIKSLESRLKEAEEENKVWAEASKDWAVIEQKLSQAEAELESRKSVCGCLAIEKENKELIEKVKALGKEMFKQNQLAFQREESLKTRLQLMGEKLKEWQDGKV